MKIGQSRAAPTARARHFLWGGILTLTFVLGLLIGQVGMPSSPWADLDMLFQRALPANDALPTLIVDMDFDDYDAILSQRQDALKNGVVISTNQDFVPAQMRLAGNNTAVPIQMRLQEGLAKYLGADDKWGFQVRVQDQNRVLGLTRFSLQDPAANHWLDQWTFVQALQREQVLTARYQFVHLVLNGDDRGIYALQEGFTPDLLRAQGRPEGVIAEFDAGRLWQSIAHFGNAQAAFADPIANLSPSAPHYLEIDTFRNIELDDPLLIEQKKQAVALLYALQTGNRPASEILDAEQYGCFLALADLWGAIDATSLVNMKYYYNASSNKLEPISFNANALGRETRIAITAAYGDPHIQAAYIRKAAQISQPQYLQHLQAELETAWQTQHKALRREFGNLKPPWQQLRQRQTAIRRSLDPVQPVFAYLAPPSDDQDALLQIRVGNVLNLPVEIVGFEINGATLAPVDAKWIQTPAPALLTAPGNPLGPGVILRALDAAYSQTIEYVQFDIPLTLIYRLDQKIDFNRPLDIQVTTRLPGLSDTQTSPVRHGLPH